MSDASLGKVIVSRTKRFGGICIALFCIPIFYTAWTHLSNSPGSVSIAYNIVLGAVLVLIGLGLSGLVLFFLTERTELHEHGVTGKSLFHPLRKILYKDLSHFTYAAISVNGVPRVTLAFGAKNIKPIRIITVGKKGIQGLDAIVDMATNVVLEKMTRLFERNGYVDIPAGLRLDQRK